ncbi:hypothetical protein ACFX10_002493 [Malus domestica]
MASSTSSPANPEVFAQNPTPISSNSAPINPNSSFSSISIQNISCMVPTKLKKDNYLTWKALFAPIFRRYKLTGIIDRSEQCPSPFLLNQNGIGTAIPNPDYEIWFEKDQNILIWLNFTLSEDLIPFTVGVTSSRELWQILEQRFGGVSTAHIHQLRSRLHAIQKGDLSISDYLQHIKGISDALMAAGAPVSEPDLIAVTLNGLSDDYESFIDSIMLRISSTSLDELHGLLMNKEIFMHRKKTAHSSSLTAPFQALAAQAPPLQQGLLPTPPPSQAYVVQHSTYNNRNNFQRHNRGRNNFQKNNRGRGNYRGNYTNSGPGNGSFHHNTSHYNRNSGGFPRSSGTRSPCQICNSFDHEALDCYARMNHAFAGKIPPAKLAAMCASTASSSQPTWLLDSGATAHVTNDISAITFPIPYSGEDKVYAGDGQGMPIQHTCSSILQTPHAAFRLNNVLHVPMMQFNLLSAYQFLRDNYCSLTLDSDGSVIKDRSTGKMLFRGPVRDGFYPLHGQPFQASYSALVSTQASLHQWHKRLGHPSTAILRRILRTNNLVPHTSTSVQFFLCRLCYWQKS